MSLIRWGRRLAGWAFLTLVAAAWAEAWWPAISIPEHVWDRLRLDRVLVWSLVTWLGLTIVFEWLDPEWRRIRQAQNREARQILGGLWWMGAHVFYGTVRRTGVVWRRIGAVWRGEPPPN